MSVLLLLLLLAPGGAVAPGGADAPGGAVIVRVPLLLNDGVVVARVPLPLDDGAVVIRNGVEWYATTIRIVEPFEDVTVSIVKPLDNAAVRRLGVYGGARGGPLVGGVGAPA